MDRRHLGTRPHPPITIEVPRFCGARCTGLDSKYQHPSDFVEITYSLFIACRGQDVLHICTPCSHCIYTVWGTCVSRLPNAGHHRHSAPSNFRRSSPPRSIPPVCCQGAQPVSLCPPPFAETRPQNGSSLLMIREPGLRCVDYNVLRKLIQMSAWVSCVWSLLAVSSLSSADYTL